LQRKASWHDEAHSFFHYRDKDGAEVDIVIERGVTALAGGEVKAGATVRPAEFRGLRKLREATGQKFRAGVVIYDGETCASFGDRFYAVPCLVITTKDHTHGVQFRFTHTFGSKVMDHFG